MHLTPWTLAVTALARSTLAASFPPAPEGITSVNSTQFPGASISWKETHICETAENTKAYSGYVHLPPDTESGLRPYPVHTFFWFFSARNDPENAPFSLWLQGGPGVPSITSALGESGPCRIEIDGKTTTLNRWSWNEQVNMLYIDQPVQVDFSYDVLTNGTINQMVDPFSVTPFDDSVPETNLTFLAGTFPSQNLTQAPNTVQLAARPMWEMMQVFLESFEPYTPPDNRISIWGESYGGHWVPEFASYFRQQNDRIGSGDLADFASKIDLDTIGLINACVDMETQMPFYPEMAYNNTYGIQAISEEEYQDSRDAWPQCRNLTRSCRTLAAELDPQGFGNNSDVNDACYYAYDWCFSRIQYPYERSGLYHFNIMESLPSAFPPKLAAGYLNEAENQQALGVPLNFTGLSVPIAKSFNLSGDFVKGDRLAILADLLDDGVKVALMYGDADYQCNWYGGEALSLAIDADVQSSFSNAGYADLQTNESYVGGLVRQYGNLSFSRVFNAGHEVPWFQPETALQIFNRVMFNKDVATGDEDVSDDYATSGPSSVADVTNEVEPGHERYCYLWDVLETCLPQEKEIIASGRAIIKNYILLGYTAANGTDVYLLNGTSVSEQLMGDGGESSNSSVANGPSGTDSPIQQTGTPSGNGAAPPVMDAHVAAGMIMSLILAVAL